jgi:hypothetical protein
MAETGSLAASIEVTDFYVSKEPEKCIDFFFVATK